MDISFFGINIAEFVKAFGYIGLFLIVFAESGLFFGFFLPGESLLFTTGLLASQGYFNIYILVVTLALAAILGDSTGYWFGKKVGPKIFNREDSKFFHKKHLDQTQKFYEKHGPYAIIIGRFIPIIRTFVPILAGVGKMKYRIFIRNNIVGGILWSAGVLSLGFYLGTVVPNIEKYLNLIIVGIVLLSLLPIIFEIIKKPTK